MITRTAALNRTSLTWAVTQLEKEAGNITDFKIANFKGLRLEDGETPFIWYLNGVWDIFSLEERAYAIIKREGITVGPWKTRNSEMDDPWHTRAMAYKGMLSDQQDRWVGSNYEMAAMRCYVGSKTKTGRIAGNEIDIPDVLANYDEEKI